MEVMSRPLFHGEEARGTLPTFEEAAVFFLFSRIKPQVHGNSAHRRNLSHGWDLSCARARYDDLFNAALCVDVKWFNRCER